MNPFIKWFDQEFERLEADWRNSIQQLDSSMLYSENQQQLSPAAEQIVKSARIVEQVFGGITANLWDDPFEWTLPETLTSTEKLFEYFGEVEATRRQGFLLFKSDEDLLKAIMTPAGETQLATLLLDTLVRARHYQFRAAEARREITKNQKAAKLAANLT